MAYENLKTFIMNYEKDNGKLLQTELIKNIIEENRDNYIDEIPDELKQIDSHKLSIIMYNILIDSLKNKDEKHICTSNLSSLAKKLYKEKIHTEKVRKVALYLITGSLLTMGGVKLVDNSKMVGKPAIIESNDYINMNPEFKRSSREEAIQREKEEKMREEQENIKMSTLYNFDEITTLNEIFIRQQTLESLNLTDEDKIYKECPISAERQWFIYQLSIINNYPVDLAFRIIETETMGKFDSSGKIAYNSETNYDLGLTQQNSDYSVKSLFCKKYEIRESDYEYVCELVRYNDYVNLAACFLKFDEIRDCMKSDGKDYTNLEEFAGYYNGWSNWKNNSISRDYVRRFALCCDSDFSAQGLSN